MKTIYWLAMALLIASFIGCSEKSDLEALAQASGSGDAGAPEPPQPGPVGGAAAQKGAAPAPAPPADGAAAPEQAAPQQAVAGIVPNEAAAKPAANAAAGNGAAPVIAGADKGEMPANYLEALTYALFNVEQRLIFEVQIPHSLDLYKAQHDNKGPASNDDFMSDIIDANGIDLPELSPGDRYLYDTKLGKLVIVHN